MVRNLHVMPLETAEIAVGERSTDGDRYNSRRPILPNTHGQCIKRPFSELNLTMVSINIEGLTTEK